MGITVGEPAPDFKLFNTEKKELSLSDLRGKNVVLLFYPFAFSSTCTAELCGMRNDYLLYQSLNAEILGISTDSLFTLKRFRDEQHLNFELLSDFNKEVSGIYDSLYEDFIFGTKGVSKRSAFVIDQSGTIRHIEILEDAGKQPDYEAIKNCLERLHQN
jgi:glutaredoxin-dependent peroxiredoxin